MIINMSEENFFDIIGNLEDGYILYRIDDRDRNQFISRFNTHFDALHFVFWLSLTRSRKSFLKFFKSGLPGLGLALSKWKDHVHYRSDEGIQGVDYVGDCSALRYSHQGEYKTDLKKVVAELDEYLRFIRESTGNEITEINSGRAARSGNLYRWRDNNGKVHVINFDLFYVSICRQGVIEEEIYRKDGCMILYRQLYDKNIELLNENESLKKEIELLENRILYQPGGNGYCRTSLNTIYRSNSKIPRRGSAEF